VPSADAYLVAKASDPELRAETQALAAPWREARIALERGERIILLDREPQWHGSALNLKVTVETDRPLDAPGIVETALVQHASMSVWDKFRAAGRPLSKPPRV
jgi:hypothetical protein